MTIRINKKTTDKYSLAIPNSLFFDKFSSLGSKYLSGGFALAKSKGKRSPLP
jgi:hypothetical protein